MFYNQNSGKSPIFLSVKQVAQRIGASRASIYRWERNGQFPRRRQISAGRVAWVEEEVTAWMLSRPLGLGQQSPTRKTG